MDKKVSLILLMSGLFGSSSSRHYYYISSSKNWFEAQSYCRARYTDLATVDNMKMMTSLLEAIDPAYNGTMWIGLMRGTQNTWGWSQGDNTLSQYSNWVTDDPKVLQCGILSLYIKGWSSHTCSHHHNVLCYNDSASDSSRWILLQSVQTWKQAQSICRQNYTDLASIHTLDEQNHVSALVSQLVYVWFGLFSDSWEWSDQSNSTFRYWADSEPSQNENCTSVDVPGSGRWYDTGCYLKQSFLCHGEKKNVIKQLVRLRVSFDANANLSDPGVFVDAISQQIQMFLENLRMSSGTELTWTEKDGNVFQPE